MKAINEGAGYVNMGLKDAVVKARTFWRATTPTGDDRNEVIVRKVLYLLI